MTIIRDIHASHAIAAQRLIKEWTMLFLCAYIEDLDVAWAVANKGKSTALVSEQLDALRLSIVAILFFLEKLALYLLKLFELENLTLLIISFAIETLQ